MYEKRLKLEDAVHESRLTPPRNAIAVSAPFRRSSTSTSINGIYLVSIATVVVSPDVSLHTASGSIDTTLYFNGGLNRPIGIRASSASGSINLSLPEQKHAQLLGVEIRNESGRTTIYLPDTFCGTLSLTSQSGALSLSEGILDHSEELEHDGQRRMYRVTPRVSEPYRDDVNSSEEDFVEGAIPARSRVPPDPFISSTTASGMQQNRV